FPIPLGQHLVQAFTVLTLASGTIGLRTTRLHVSTKLGLIAGVAVIVLLGAILDASGWHYAHLLILISFYSYATWLAGRQVLFTGPIDTNKVVGAICIYLLMGLIWALSYLLIAQAIPGAFNGLEQSPWYENFADVSYYSYVTLTTLGYGDISPVAPVARFLVYMEAIVGVFYMAILVASLIGIRISTIQAKDD
ncbi:MAG: potassium channel family protein, partial [Gammaproteobacteria bacterium]|nr:potassium channel family protein [Gammaproteobacteria bacterium]